MNILNIEQDKERLGEYCKINIAKVNKARYKKATLGKILSDEKDSYWRQGRVYAER